MKYKTVLLDADNTFFDFDKTELSALTELSKWANFEDSFLFIDTFNPINRALWSGLEKGEVEASDINNLRFRKLVKTLDLNQDPNLMADKYIELLSQGTYMIDGAINMLSQLSKKFILVVITNGLSKVQRGRLRANDIENYFSEVAISEELGCSKPSINFFQKTMEMGNWGSKDQIIAIGDNLSSDIAGAENFGIDSIWFNPENNSNNTKFKPTYEVNHLSEIFPLLKNATK